MRHSGVQTDEANKIYIYIYIEMTAQHNGEWTQLIPTQISITEFNHAFLAKVKR
jgi:hypothetical protein